jgi:hypothetical protein
MGARDGTCWVSNLSAADSGSRSAQAGSVMTASAMRVPSRWCNSRIHDGRNLVSERSSDGGARVRARRHHRAAAGISSGSGPCWDMALLNSAATSAPARAAPSRWVASRGQSGPAFGDGGGHQPSTGMTDQHIRRFDQRRYRVVVAFDRPARVRFDRTGRPTRSVAPPDPRPV